MSYKLSLKNITKYFGNFKALDNVNFDIEVGKFATLLGPSGCGKTTLLRILAGFIEPDEGQVLFNGKVMNDVPPNKRNTAMCFQSYALFPNKTVYNNICFGLRMRKVPEVEQRKRTEAAIKMVNLSGLGKRKPYELSGGQQQRVALARAIVVRPDILLFDEPLSNLDAKLRERVRVEIREIQKTMGITTIYVTHDQAEALAISDMIFAMNQGTIVQESSARTIYDNPSTKFVADFIGTANIVDGIIISSSNDLLEIDCPYGKLYSKKTKDITNKNILVCIRPEDLVPVSSGKNVKDTNIISGIISNSLYMGNTIDLFVKCNNEIIRVLVSKDYSNHDNKKVNLAVSYGKVLVLER